MRLSVITDDVTIVMSSNAPDTFLILEEDALLSQIQIGSDQNLFRAYSGGGDSSPSAFFCLWGASRQPLKVADKLSQRHPESIQHFAKFDEV